MIELIAVVLLFAIIAGIYITITHAREQIKHVSKPTWEQEQRQQAILRASRKHSASRFQVKSPTRLP